MREPCRVNPPLLRRNVAHNLPEKTMTSAETWYYSNQGTSIGPVNGEQMQTLVQRGMIARDTLVWPGFGGWVAAESTTLAALFHSVPQPGVPPMPQNVTSAKVGMFKDKRMRTIIGILALILGLYAMYDGFGDIRTGLGGGESASNSQITFQGCVGVGANAMQCAYQNTGQVEAKLCMNVVVTCDDGRHVASSCSDPIPPGQMSSKLVDNFSPSIQPTNSCNNIQYENVKTQE